MYNFLYLQDQKDKDKKKEELEQQRSESSILGTLVKIDLLQTLLKPFNPNFNLDLYEQDKDFEENRRLDEEDRLDQSCRRPDNTPAPTIGRVQSTSIGERQREFYSNLPDVQATTGAPVKLVGAMWAIESRFGNNTLSPTGCQGDMQFTRGTFAAMIEQYGDQIPGMESYAIALRNKTIGKHDPELQKFRNDPTVAGYASGFYMAEIAKTLKIDINDEKNWKYIYAAYNVGPSSVRKLQANAGNDVSAQDLLGKVAIVNPMFYGGGKATSAQALANYQIAVENGAKAFDKLIVAKLDPAARESTITVANADSKGIQSNTNLGEGFVASLLKPLPFLQPAGEAGPAAPKQERTLFPSLAYM
jgi:hypothetical protein